MQHIRLKSTILSLSTAMLLGITGCSSGSSSDDGVEGSLDTVLSGVGIDGYLSQATVCLDLNLDGYCQIGDEPASYTKADGTFSLSLSAAQKLAYKEYAKAPLLIYNGFDIDTGVEFTGKLRAPLGDGTAVNVSPISTIVHSVMEGDKTKEEAEALVSNMLGLDGVDLGEDPVAAAKENPELLKAALKLQKIIEVLAAAKKRQQEENAVGSSDSANKLVEDLYEQFAMKAIADQNLSQAIGNVVSDDGLDADAESSATLISGQIELIIGDDGVADTAVIGTKIGAVKQELVVAIDKGNDVPKADTLKDIRDTSFSLLHAQEILRIVDMEDVNTSTTTMLSMLSMDVQTVLVAAGMNETEFLPVETEIKVLKDDAKTFLVGAKFDDLRNASVKAEQERAEAEAKAVAEKAALEAKIAKLEGALKEAAQAEADAAEAKAQADAVAAAAAADAERLARLEADALAAVTAKLLTDNELKTIQDEKDIADTEQAAAEKVARIQEIATYLTEVDAEVTTVASQAINSMPDINASMSEIFAIANTYPTEVGQIATDANASVEALKVAFNEAATQVGIIRAQLGLANIAVSENSETNAVDAKTRADAALATFKTQASIVEQKAKEIEAYLVQAKAIKETIENKPPVVGADNVFTLPLTWVNSYVDDNGLEKVLKLNRTDIDSSGLVTETKERYNLTTGELLEDNSTQDDLEYELVAGAWVTADTSSQAQVTLSSDATVAHYSIINADVRIVSVMDLNTVSVLPITEDLSIPITFTAGAKATQYEYRMNADRYKLNESTGDATIEEFITDHNGQNRFTGDEEAGLSFEEAFSGTLVEGSNGNLTRVVNRVVSGVAGTWEYKKLGTSDILAIVFTITDTTYPHSDSENNFLTMFSNEAYRGYADKASTEYQQFDDGASFNEIAYEDAKAAIEDYFEGIDVGSSDSNTTSGDVEVDSNLSATILLTGSQLVATFNQDMKYNARTSGEYDPSSSYWKTSREFVIDFNSYVPNGTITLHADGFITTDNKIMNSDILFTFPEASTTDTNTTTPDTNATAGIEYSLPFEIYEQSVYTDNGVSVIKLKGLSVDNSGLVSETREKFNLATGESIVDNSTTQIEYRLDGNVWDTVDQSVQKEVTLSENNTVAYFSVIDFNMRIKSVRDLSAETTLVLNDTLSIPVQYSSGAEATMYEYKILTDKYMLEYSTGSETLEDFIANHTGANRFSGSDEDSISFEKAFSGTLVEGSTGNIIRTRDTLVEIIGTWEYAKLGSSDVLAIVFAVDGEGNDEVKSSFYTMYSNEVYWGYGDKAMSEYEAFENYNEIAYKDVKSALAAYFVSLDDNTSIPEDGNTTIQSMDVKLTPADFSNGLEGTTVYGVTYDETGTKSIVHVDYTSNEDVNMTRLSGEYAGMSAQFTYIVSNNNEITLYTTNDGDNDGTSTYYTSYTPLDTNATYDMIGFYKSADGQNRSTSYVFSSLADAEDFIPTHNVIGSNYYLVGYTPGSSESYCMAQMEFTDKTTIAHFVDADDTGELRTEDLGFVATPLIALDLQLSNDNVFFMTADPSLIQPENPYIFVGFFSTIEDTRVFLTENSMSDCTRYFPQP